MVDTKRRASVVVAASEAGKPLIDVLSSRFRYHDRNQWLEHIDRNRLMINGYPACADTVLRSGDFLEYCFQPIPEPPVDADFSIVFEDRHILVINKPPCLPCHPSGRYFHHTLWSLLRKAGIRSHMELINRIDRETSGLVLIAKTPEAAHACRHQFEKRRVFKRYLALVHGRFTEKRIMAQGWMAPDSASRIRKKQRFYPLDRTPAHHARACATVICKRKTGDRISLVQAFARTGRTHQIRATLLALGYPVVGDKLYGLDEEIFIRFIEDRISNADVEKLMLSHQALHAAELRLLHPESRLPVRFLAPMPADMKNLADQQ